MEFSGKSLQNLWNKWPPHPVWKPPTFISFQVVAGRSPLCDKRSDEKAFPVIDAAFSPEGTLYVAEERPGPAKAALRAVDQNGAVQEIAGFADACNCAGFFNCTEKEAVCEAAGNVLSTRLAFAALSAVAVAPDGTVHVADNGQARILGLRSASVASSDPSGDVSVADPVARELYTFNRYGKHVKTRGLETGALLYSFAYSKNTVFGRLTVVHDGLGNKLTLQRDYTNRVQSIENALGQKHAVTLSRFGNLLSFHPVGGGTPVRLEYLDDISGLLAAKSFADGDFFAYRYDSDGRLTLAVSPTGEAVSLETSASGCEEDEVRLAFNTT